MRVILFVSLAIVASGPRAVSQHGRQELKFGMSTALSGPAAALGLAMKAGVEAAFHEANSRGGIRGRNVVLLARDDGYEPSRAAPNVRRLIENDEVLAIVGNVGTPTAVAAMPIAIEKKTLFYGAFTGAGALRKSPPERYVVNYRASYAQETAAMVDALVRYAGIRPQEVGFFTQRDSFGAAGYVGGIEALKRHGLADEFGVAHGCYERNTTAVEAGLADILQNEPLPKAIIMVGTYAPCAAFIREARKAGLDALFLDVSFVGASALIQALGNSAEGVVVTQVVPPLESGLDAVKEYRAALTDLDPGLEPCFGSLEGYLAARVLLRALRNVEGEPTRESIVDALEGLGSFDLGLGAPLVLTRNRHQADDRVWPTIVRGGKAVGFEWEALVPPPLGVR